MSGHDFGGTWTRRKLDALRDYLLAYQKIFKHSPKARMLRTVYVDAFAGTGERDIREAAVEPQLFGYADEDIKRYQEGSAKIALSLPEKFDQYVFLDAKASHVEALRQLVRREFAELENRCLIARAEANRWLQSWCARENWRGQRAVVFLDPYGMEVEWETLKAIADTQAIDLWVLFPLGIGANRTLPADMPPQGAWARRLTKLFGTDEWRDRFYRREPRHDLFGKSDESWKRAGDVMDILDFFLSRLKTVFATVVTKPLILRNSRNSPMYALCFAAGNPRGSRIALRIASHLTRD